MSDLNSDEGVFVYTNEEQDCWKCGGDGYIPHDCFEDTCCCLDPDDDICDICNGEGVV